MSSLQLKQIVQYLPNWSAKNNSVWRFLRIPSSNRPYFWPMAKSSLSLSNHSSRFGWSEELLSDTREGSSRYTYVLQIKWHCFCSLLASTWCWHSLCGSSELIRCYLCRIVSNLRDYGGKELLKRHLLLGVQHIGFKYYVFSDVLRSKGDPTLSLRNLLR